MNIDPNGIAEDIFLKNKNNYCEEEYLCGDCFLINRKLIDRIGYFDCARFVNLFGDVDFGIRTKAFNFNYLPPEQRTTKLNKRRYQLVEDWARFKTKYNLPIDLPYMNINEIDFKKLQKQFDKSEQIKKLDYSEYLI